MDTNYRTPHAVATAIGTCAVAYQSAVVWEAYESASLVTKLGIPLATISAALLPALAEAAWAGKERIKACLLALPVIALVAFVLPSGVSRLGEPQEAKKAAAAMSDSQMREAQADHTRAKRLVADTMKRQEAACKSGVTDRCKGETYTLKQQTAHLNSLTTQIKPPVVEPWLPTWHPATLPIGLELAIWGCFFFAFGPLARRSADVQLDPPPGDGSASLVAQPPLDSLARAGRRWFGGSGARGLPGGQPGAQPHGCRSAAQLGLDQ